MKKFPGISIIIPTYNEKKYIAKCINSLLDLSYKGKIEILVSDGRSTDKTREIIKDFQKKHKHITLLDNKEKYPAQGRNLAIKKSKYDLIVYIDGHSYVSKSWLDNLYSSFVELRKKNPKTAGVGSITRDAEKSNFSTATTIGMGSILGGAASSYSPKKDLRKVITAFACLYDKKILNKVGLYDPRFIKGQDLELNLRIKRNGYDLYVNPKAVTYYYKRKSYSNLFKQMLKYGFWRYKVMRHTKVFFPVTIIPSIFVLFLVFLIVASIFSRFALSALALVLVAYFSIISIAVIFHSIKQKRFMYELYLVFLCIHFGYGIGLLISLFKKVEKIKDRG
jgi:glycosyltransferase involved in cell wall biosynthesis